MTTTTDTSHAQDTYLKDFRDQELRLQRLEGLCLTQDGISYPSSPPDYQCPDYQRLSYECLNRMEKNMDQFAQCISVTPQEGLLPENKGRQTADKTGINCLAGKVVPNNTLLKAGVVFLAAPKLYETYKIPWGTIVDATSNAKTFLETDCSTHTKNWWGTASALATRGAEWLGNATSDISKAATSIDPSLLLGLGAAGVGLAAAAYGAYRWYHPTDGSKTDEETKESATIASNTERRTPLSALQSQMSQMSRRLKDKTSYLVRS